jgi:hypothetical protein
MVRFDNNDQGVLTIFQFVTRYLRKEQRIMELRTIGWMQKNSRPILAGNLTGEITLP